MKILLVDDSRTMRNIEKTVLANLPGVEFSEASDGLEALAVIGAAARPFNMILVDWNMPRMDGITLVHKIRATDSKTPLMIATTEAEKERILEAIRAGVNNYVIKPFSSSGLLDKVKQTLAKAAA